MILKSGELRCADAGVAMHVPIHGNQGDPGPAAGANLFRQQLKILPRLLPGKQNIENAGMGIETLPAFFKQPVFQKTICIKIKDSRQKAGQDEIGYEQFPAKTHDSSSE
jgi:hypothetical protein